MSRMQNTSLEAYEDKQASGSLESDRAHVLDLIREHRGLTIWQTAALMGVGDNRISGRFSELQDQNRIRKSNVYAVNPQTGKRAIVWIATGVT